MVANLQNSGPQGRARVNAYVRWELARAVNAAGPAFSAVRAYLRK